MMTALGIVRFPWTTGTGSPTARPAQTIRAAFVAVITGVLLLVPTSALPRSEVFCNQKRVKPLRHISGIVIDQSGAPIAGVKVTILEGAKEVAAAHTGGNGKFSFEGLKEGDYEVQTKAEGFYDFRFPVVLVRPRERWKRALEVVLTTGGEQCSGVRLVKLKVVEQRSHTSP